MKKYLIFALIVLVSTLVGCNKKPVEFIPDRIEANHEFLNDDFLSFIKLSTDLELDQGQITPKYSMTAFMHIARGTNRKINYYQVDWITSDNTYDIYYRNEVAVTTPSRFIAQEFLPFVKVSDNAIDTIKAHYKYQSSINEVMEVREVKYKEEVLNFNEEDYTQISNQDDVFNISLKKSNLNDDKYRFKYSINFKTEDEAVHLDMQSWIKTKDGDIYPLMGLYNYATFSEDYISVSDEIVDKVVEIEEIYIKLIYSYNDNLYTLTNIFDINSL